MKINYERDGIMQTVIVENEFDIEKALNELHPERQPFVILETGNGDFIQCAGSTASLTVEVRLYNGDSFRHFVVGSKEESKVWHIIDCRVGPIRVLGHEDLTLKNAIELFNHFYLKKELCPSYNKRNVTKQFKKN